MNAKHLIFGSLGAMAVLVAALLVASDEEGARTDAERPGDAVAWTAPGSEATRPEASGDSLHWVAGASDAGTGAPPPTGAAAADPAGAAPGTTPAAGAPDAAAGAPIVGSRTGAAGRPAPSGTPAAPSVGSPQDSTAAVLRATARAYDDVRALRAGFEQRLENTLLGTTVPSRGTLYQRHPDRFLMRFSEPEGDLIVSDGEYFWLYFPSSDPDQVLRTRRGAQGLDLRSQFIGDPVARFDATYEGRESDRGRETHVITLVPREPAGYRKLKVWIDARDHLVRRFDLTEGNGIVRHFVLSDLTINPSLPNGLFEFTPPEGARVVNQG